MSKLHANSSPEILPCPRPDRERATMEGMMIAAKHLTKSIEEINGNDTDKRDLLANLTTLVENFKSTLTATSPDRQGRPPAHHDPASSELRRCFTDPHAKPDEPTARPRGPVHEEIQRLRKELSASMAARKSLERMFSSLGKEKEIISAELARKVQEIGGMEEHLNDLKAQNEKLLAKVQTCANEHKERRGRGGGSNEKVASLQDRNQKLSDQLLKSLESYRTLKRRVKEVQEENARLSSQIASQGIAVSGKEEAICSKDTVGITQKDTGKSPEDLFVDDFNTRKGKGLVMEKGSGELSAGKQAIVT
ncbi:hypothetical protein AMTRI_Chr01g136480 [Amborella trichopoda]